MPARNSACICGSGKRFKHCHGQLEQNLPGQITFPFSARFDQLSLSSCYLELFANNSLIGNATGFLWRHSDDVYLVTNWHVVNNKDIFTGKTLEGPTCPDTIQVYASVQTSPSAEDTRLIGANARGVLQAAIKVCVYDDFEKPHWLQHKDCPIKRIDVILLKLPASELGSTTNKIVCINDYGFGKLLMFPGSEIFIIGYPMRESVASYKLPIWKNGTIAREPFSGWQNRPAFLVDGRTSKGMSGSPVVRRDYGPSTTSLLETHLDVVVTSEFLGIYSGRLIDGDDMPSIGIVWWRSVIDEILARPEPAQRYFDT